MLLTLPWALFEYRESCFQSFLFNCCFVFACSHAQSFVMFCVSTLQSLMYPSAHCAFTFSSICISSQSSLHSSTLTVSACASVAQTLSLFMP